MLGRIGSALALASVTTLMVVGCTPEEPVESTPPPSSPATASPEATPLSDEQLLDEAFNLSSEFVTLVDEGFASGELPIDRMEKLASEEAIAEVQADLAAFQEQGLSLAGRSTLDSPVLTARDAVDGVSGTARLLVCIDTSGITATDQDGLEIDGGVSRQPRVFVLDYRADGATITDIGPPAEDPELSGCGS